MVKNTWKRMVAFASLFAVLFIIGVLNLARPEPKYTYSAGEAVYLGGMPIGVTIRLNSVIVVGRSEVITPCGVQYPASESGIENGDILLEVNGTKITATEQLLKLVAALTENQTVAVKVRRQETEFETVIRPALDVATNRYKLGLLVKDNTAGVGTMTFMREDGSFAALGHPITDAATGEMLKVNEGNVYPCKIVGVTKGVRGRAGELKGMFVKANGCIGSISDNTKYGLFGKIERVIANPAYPEPVTAAGKSCAHPGRAEIITTVEGDCPKAYEISIVKCCNQPKAADRSMVLKVTDKRLLEKTGGIVQGMSGSPIVQDGRLIGAVTHVFINDPTRGYGVYIDWML